MKLPATNTRGLAGLLILIGVLFGPVYLLSWERISGSDGPSFELTERGQRWTLADGTILHFAKGQAYRPLALDLDPKMNRIGLRLTFHALAAGTASSAGADDYEVTVMQGDQPILQRPLRVDIKPGSTRTVDAGTLEVYFPGTYTFILETPDAPHTPIERVGLALREKAEMPTMAVVWVGLAALVAGLALFLEPFLPGRRYP